MTLPAGRFPILRASDLPIAGATPLKFRGPIRVQNTRHGARIMVAVNVIDPNGRTVAARELFVSFHSASYVRLCKKFGDDVTRWRGTFAVAEKTNARDGRSRVEVCP